MVRRQHVKARAERGPPNTTNLVVLCNLQWLVTTQLESGEFHLHEAVGGLRLDERTLYRQHL
eukprot:COSAG01_NODE_532_length_15843_cov_58.969258_2_plen_62_part_00